jgi:hypothetical protein
MSVLSLEVMMRKLTQLRISRHSKDATVNHHGASFSSMVGP